MKLVGAQRSGGSRRTMLMLMACATLAIAAVSGVGRAQAAGAVGATGFAYDVATIKPAPSGPVSMMGAIPQRDGVHVENLTVRDLVRVAYGYGKFPSDERVLGLPEWGKTDRFNIDAKMGEADVAAMKELSKEEQSARREKMMQALLADRFKLKTHVEQRQLPVFDLVPAKGGTKLKESNPADEVKSPTGMAMKGKVMLFTGGKLRAQQYTMKEFADFLSSGGSGVGRPVVDKTGLTGQYSFELPMAVMRMGAVSAPAGEGEISIFTSVQDELGLKLQPSTAMLDVMVIDHVERPTEN